ncbi:hypothetical protein [Maribellus mangrovi]|uniref:hypothetical protein n=1 Tax=Maribellus mangrovi TaxID=3133146 RepID=UPI0030EB1DFE
MKFQKLLALILIGILSIIEFGCNYNDSNKQQNKAIEYMEVRGVKIPKKSRLEHQGQELLIYLSEPTEIKGYLVRKRKHTNDHCTLDEHGNLIFFVPQNDLIIEGVPCKGQSDIWLYPGGKLYSCHLSKNFEHSGQTFSKHQHIMIDENSIMQTFNLDLFWEYKNRGLYPQHH